MSLKHDDDDFLAWKADVKNILRDDHSWSEEAIETIDWDNWNDYFLYGSSPKEAVEEELYAA